MKYVGVYGENYMCICDKGFIRFEEGCLLGRFIIDK